MAALLLWAIAGCTGHKDSATEIAVLGGNHLAYLYDPDYSPAHLRTLLAKLKPDVIAIENLPELQAAGKRFWTFLPEYCVAQTFASAKGVPVVGVDWDSVPYYDVDCLAFRKERAAADLRERRGQMDAVARSTGEWQAGLLFRESPGGMDSVYGNLEEESSDPEWNRRDDRIAENIIQTARRHPGKRIAVILGSYHLLPQAKRLGRHQGIRVLDVKRFLPLRQDEIDAAWQKADYQLVLGASLDSWLAPAVQHMRNHQRSKELLDKLKSLDPASALAQYYEARWHLMFGRSEKARAILENIIARPSVEQLPCQACSEWSWPPWSSLKDKAAFTLATILDGERNREPAIAIYRRLLASLPANQLRPRFRGGPGIYYDLREYIESLIREPYSGGVAEAFRARDARRCWLAAEIPTDAWPE